MSVVLFDIDGTLMRNAGPHHKDALVSGIRNATGVTTTLDGVATAGMLDRDLIRRMLRAAGVSERRVQAAMKSVVAACQSAYRECGVLDLRERLCPGVVECLSELRARGVVLGVVTGNLTAIGWRKLECAGVREFFSVGAFAEDGRTRGRLALIAARRARLLNGASGKISLIGDHANDVLAAKANSFQAVAVATGVMPYEELQAHAPDILVRNLTDLEIGRLL
jgi:phosphoglycolate phosphatase-like HAD superfamily hydrolase